MSARLQSKMAHALMVAIVTAPGLARGYALIGQSIFHMSRVEGRTPIADLLSMCAQALNNAQQLTHDQVCAWGRRTGQTRMVLCLYILPNPPRRNER